MIDPEDYTYKEPEEVEETTEVVEEKREVIAKGAVAKKDPKYFYFINKEGDLCKSPRVYRGSKTKTAKKAQIINYFDKVNLTVPKVMVDGYVSKKFKTVRTHGYNGAMIWVPRALLGKTYQVILIPKDDWVVSQIR